MSNEIFNCCDRGAIFENRAVPPGLRFRLHEKANLRAYYRVRSGRGPDEWRHFHVLGTAPAFSLSRQSPGYQVTPQANPSQSQVFTFNCPTCGQPVHAS